MGRFYNGNISGKFWFGVQSSDDISNLINIFKPYLLKYKITKPILFFLGL